MLGIVLSDSHEGGIEKVEKVMEAQGGGKANDRLRSVIIIGVMAMTRV